MVPKLSRRTIWTNTAQNAVTDSDSVLHTYIHTYKQIYIAPKTVQTNLKLCRFFRIFSLVRKRELRHTRALHSCNLFNLACWQLCHIKSSFHINCPQTVTQFSSNQHWHAWPISVEHLSFIQLFAVFFIYFFVVAQSTATTSWSLKADFNRNRSKVCCADTSVSCKRTFVCILSFCSVKLLIVWCVSTVVEMRLTSCEH